MINGNQNSLNYFCQLLLHDKNEWNNWRQKYVEVQPNLSAIKLNKADLNGIDFTKIQLNEAQLIKAILTNANLTGAILKSANLTEANLIGAILVTANLRKANLSYANLSWADLSKANLTEATLYKTDLSGAFLRWTVLNGSKLNYATLKWTCLSGSFLKEANLNHAKLNHADLRWCNLSEANLSLSDLAGANLSWADLTGADLTGADLTGADLTGANLINTNLSEANLTKANLSKANLTRANLTNATLTGIRLTDTQITRETIISEKWRNVWKILNGKSSELDLVEADLSEVNLSGANLSGIKLDGADLSKADLSKTDLTNANLKCANLRQANLTGAKLRSASLFWADLTDADLTDADLFGADLTGAIYLSQTHPYLAIVSPKKHYEFILKEKSCWGLGRDHENELAIHDSCISRKHALLQLTDTGEFSWVDLGSQNGSFINRNRVVLPVILKDSDCINIGQTKIIFHQPKKTWLDILGSSSDNLVTDESLISVMVVNLSDFTKLYQNIDDNVLSQVIGSWFRFGREILSLHGCCLLRFIDHTIIAIWFHKDNSLIAEDLVRIFKAVNQLNCMTHNLSEQFLLRLFLKISVGINTDSAKVSNKGTELYADYTNNLAFSLESATKEIGLNIAISETSFEYLSVINQAESIFQKSKLEPSDQEKLNFIYATSLEKLNNLLI